MEPRGMTRGDGGDGGGAAGAGANGGASAAGGHHLEGASDENENADDAPSELLGPLLEEWPDLMELERCKSVPALYK